MATTTSRAEARSTTLDYWLMQQGRRFWIQRGSTRPDLKNEKGEKRKLTLGAFASEEEARKRFATIQKLYQHDEIELGGGH